MTRLHKITSILLICFHATLFGQMQEYGFQRDLTGIAHEWHAVMIPSEMFSHLKQDLTDVRIYGISEENDTIEAPYILKINGPTTDQTIVNFKLINESKTENGYYYTFEIPTKVAINSIKLQFNRTNFDWRVHLEGSHNQKEWFTIKDNYRILAIKNAQTDYKFTTLTFPDSKYAYYRIKVGSKEHPAFKKASIKQINKNEGIVIAYQITSFTTEESNAKKQSISYLEFEHPVPLSQLKFNIANKQDYYRNMSIEYLVDSIQTDKGWKHNYRKLASGTLNSMDDNSFDIHTRIVQNIKVIIENNDNEPVTISSIEAKGYVHQLTARFNKPATYYLAYSNAKALRPKYDITRFQENIPQTLTPLTLGAQVKIKGKNVAQQAPLFENETWLWAIMIVVVLVLGLFTYKMFSGTKAT